MTEEGQKKAVINEVPAVQPNGAATGNNYYRAEGQNVGNFLTDKPSSRVLAPPGGGSQISFGSESAPTPDAKVLFLFSCLKCSSHSDLLRARLVANMLDAKKMLSRSCLMTHAESRWTSREGHQSLHGWRKPNWWQQQLLTPFWSERWQLLDRQKHIQSSGTPWWLITDFIWLTAGLVSVPVPSLFLARDFSSSPLPSTG